MDRATFRFYAHLNDHLASHRRQVNFPFTIGGRRSIKDMIEALGVPHTEVALILVNGNSVDFRYHVQPGDYISVYPAFESIDISSIARLRPDQLTEARFVADIHLGRLVAYLRMLGFDTLYPEDYRDEELARISSDEERILLTRDRGLLKRGNVHYGYYVQNTDPWKQLGEVIKRFKLMDSINQFQRCTRCNDQLVLIAKDAISQQIPSNIWEQYDEFLSCATCDKIYWKGSHYQQIDDFIRQVQNNGS